jgi:hypothetical protein
LCPIAEFISHKTNPKEWDEMTASSPSQALKIRRRSQHQQTLDLFSIEMSEVSGVAGQ